MADNQTKYSNARTSDVGVSQLCRLCALQSAHSVPIFEGPGLKLELERKLQEHLSLKVSKTDVLPHQICVTCSNTLVSWDMLVFASKEAEKRLIFMINEKENRPDSDDAILLTTKQGPGKGQFPSQLVSAQSRPTAIGRNVLLTKSPNSQHATNAQPSFDLVTVNPTTPKIDSQKVSKSPDSGNAATVQSGQLRAAGELTLSRPCLSFLESFICFLNTRDAGNKRNVRLLRRSNSGQKAVGQVQTTPAMTNSTELTSTVNPSVLTRSAKYLRPPISNPLISINSSSVHKDSIMSSLDNDLKNVPEETASGETAKRKIFPMHTRTISEDGGQTTDKPAPEETDPLPVTVVDHRNSKSFSFEKKSVAEDSNTEKVGRSVPVREEEHKGCFVCGKMIQNRTLLLAHERFHFKAVESANYKCRLCSEVYRNYEEMVSHRDKHQEEGVLKRKLSDESSNLVGPGTSKSAEKVKKSVPAINCVICDVSFKNERQLYQHIMSSHTEEERAILYKCSICDKCFERKSLLQNHVKIHAYTLEPYDKISRDRELKKHIQYKHYSANPFKRHRRELRPRKYFSKTGLTLEMNLHNGTKRHTCEQCGKEFHNLISLKQHQAAHSDARPYVCHDCGKTFKLNKNLAAHAVRHLSDSRRVVKEAKSLRPLLCDVCGKTFGCAATLKIHKYRLHPEVFYEQNPHLQELACPLCLRVFTKQGNVDRHVVNCLANGPLTFQCPDCGKTCVGKKALVIHQREHMEARPHACSLCGKSFQSRGHLSQHMDSHSDVRQFQCQYCDKGFKRKMHLETHVYTHTGEKPYVCDICGRGFTQRSDVHKHKTSMHFNEIFLQCSICEITFKSKSGLNKHLLKHSETK